MPVNSKGKYFANPSVGKMHEGMAPSGEPHGKESMMGHADESSHGHPPAHTVTVHKAGGKFHSAGYHEGGVHSAEHDSQDQAMEHAKGCMNCSGDASSDGEMDDFMGGAK